MSPQPCGLKFLKQNTNAGRTQIQRSTNGMQWNIGNGSTVRFWSDSWLPSGITLKDVTMQPMDPLLASAMVDQFLDGNDSQLYIRIRTLRRR
ncbi:hypothetical protein TSUD_06590 [Trifolium subterraneum]|uniref:Reverse transcriptase zinc-binding domain-containing protein n=1 Tax=Trifolium subterraneum TaxID=3900 RepID=A0A2Z6MPW9_TRISU|nr:hypothetical protein TSUD_06590 [Trifolium subterraneum]